MKIINIDVTKIDKALFKPGKKPDAVTGKVGQYMDLVCFDKPDNYGNDGFVVQGVSKEQRAAGVRGSILGNWKAIGAIRQPSQPARQQPSNSQSQEKDIPF